MSDTEPNEFNSQCSQQLPPLQPPSALFLQDILHDENDRKVAGYVNQSTEFFSLLGHIAHMAGPAINPVQVFRTGREPLGVFASLDRL
jgi:hypothetical protein